MRRLEKEAIDEIKQRSIQIAVHTDRGEPEKASEKLGRILTLCEALLEES